MDLAGLASQMVGLQALLGTVQTNVANGKGAQLLEAINKVIKGYAKFSATPKYMVYN